MRYNAPLCEVIEFMAERGFADSYGEEGAAGQSLGLYEYYEEF